MKRKREKMEIINYSGIKDLRLTLVLATLSSIPIIVDDIHADETLPGLRQYELSLINLIKLICDGHFININDTGTKLTYKPGIILGGKYGVSHDCGVTRSIGYFLEPLIVLGLFAKKPLSITLTGITNDSKDPSVDTFMSTTLPMLKRFGVPSEGLRLNIESRGAHPLGGGAVTLSMPIIQNLTAVNWIDEGVVKRIRGVSFSTRVSGQLEKIMIRAARGTFNKLLPDDKLRRDVYISTDHKSGQQAGKSCGYGISLVAETSSGCCISVDTAFPREHKLNVGGIEDVKPELTPPDEVGENIACALLEEIMQGGVVDSTHQGLLFLLCALCPHDISKVRVGKLSPHGIETLRYIRHFLKVQFDIKADPATGTVILKCLGSGIKSYSRNLF